MYARDTVNIMYRKAMLRMRVGLKIEIGSWALPESLYRINDQTC